MNVQSIASMLYRVAESADREPNGANTTQPARYTIQVTKPTGFFTDFGSMISSILNIVLTISVVAVLLYLIWGGLEWVTSGGDKAKTESARNKITAAIVGLIIIVSAWAIMLFVQNLLGVTIFTKS